MATLLSFFFWAITKEKRRIKIKILKKLRNYGRNILIERGTRMTKIMLEDSEKRIIEELKDPKEAALFLNELLSVSDANPEIRYKAFLKGLSLVMKAYGISKLAKSTGLNRTNLYQSIVSEKNTKLDKVFKILDELDLNIEITSKPRKQAESIRS
jgi:probable addiction module antidote protein